MSADLLRRAADLIEWRATAATPGPWRTEDVEGIFYITSATHGPVTMDNDNPVCSCGDDEGVAIERDESEGGRADAAWMTTLGPQVAAPLAAWLRAEAGIADHVFFGGFPMQVTRPSVAFARAVLNEESW